MTTRLEVFNVAADALGEPPFMSDLDEGRLGRVFRARWDGLVREVLEGYDWNFAQLHVELARLTETPIGWEYAYNKPADCLRIVGLSRTGLRGDDMLDYDDAAGRIVCNEDVVYLRYVSSTFINQTGAWPSLLRTAVGLMLASEQNRRATQNRGAGIDLYQLAEAKLKDARRWDAAQRPWDRKPTGQFVRSRTQRVRRGYD